jgi:hypothetical protein
LVNGSGEATKIETVYSIDDNICGYIPDDISNAPDSGSILRQKLAQKNNLKGFVSPGIKHKTKNI